MNILAGALPFSMLGSALASLPAAAGPIPPREPVPFQETAPGRTADTDPAIPSDYVELPGNVHPALAGARPLGPVPPQAPMARMLLALKPPPGAEARLERRLAELQDRGSEGYHRWLSPAQFGAEFGPGTEALDRVTAWLKAGGFTVDEVAAGRMAITFSGTVATVERAFHTAIRNFDINGTVRQANIKAPSIPRALSDVIEGVVSLHNIPRPALNRGFTSRARAAGMPGYSHDLTPGDFAAIYNVAPLYRENIDGSGVSIAIVGRTHIPLADPATFRREFDLPARELLITINGPDPGDLGPDEDGEADLDVEWSGAVARKAAIRFVVSGSTDSTDGVDLSAQYIVDHDLAAVMSTSFGQCETSMGAAEMAFYKHLWAQAAAQGITSLVASGDSGPAGCNSGEDSSGSGRAVSGLASSPNAVAVGGTQFFEGSGSYWGTGKNQDGSSALGYIPETAWNESGSTPEGYGLWATGGGPSWAYPRPAWQADPDMPGDSRHRCLPDVALTAASHDGYLVETGGRQTITGGTSCSSPAFAGLMALVVQKTGSRQGNANPVLYRLGAAQRQGTGPSVFHDILAGTSTVPGTQGYACGPGYNLATGLGSVDAQALLAAWTGPVGHAVEASIQAPAADLAIASGTRVAFAGSAQASDPAARLTYAWDFGDGATAAGASASHVYRNPGPATTKYLATFTAMDGAGAKGSDFRSITVAPALAAGEHITNGGFENGAAGWAALGMSIGDNNPREPAHRGRGDAWFAGGLAGLPAILGQTVQLPAGSGPARLTFWLHIESSGIAAAGLDTFLVQALGAGGSTSTLASFSNRDAAPGYRQHSIDMAAYRGQKVKLSFVAACATPDLTTSFVLDDVSLLAE